MNFDDYHRTLLNQSIQTRPIYNIRSFNQQLFTTLEDKEVVVICFDHRTVDPRYLQDFVSETNDMLMPINYVILEDHPDIPEYINGVNMNFGKCGLMIMSKLDMLNKASDQIRAKGYYDVWSQEDLDNVVTWRYK